MKLIRKTFKEWTDDEIRDLLKAFYTSGKDKEFINELNSLIDKFNFKHKNTTNTLLTYEEYQNIKRR